MVKIKKPTNYSQNNFDARSFSNLNTCLTFDLARFPFAIPENNFSSNNKLAFTQTRYNLSSIARYHEFGLE
jgi:hypothetical protein